MQSSAMQRVLLVVVTVLVMGSTALDTATLMVKSDGINSPMVNHVELWGITTNCYRCLRLPIFTELNTTTQNFTVDTRYPYQLEFRIFVGKDYISKNFTYHYGENGTYFVILEDTGSADPYTSNWNVEVIVEQQPINSFLPILVAFFVFLGVAILWNVILFLNDRYNPKNKPNKLLKKQEEEESSKPAEKKTRIRSLDAFRGISIAIMIFVNYGGGGYYFFDHSTWNGLTVADLVFPWFIYIMGTSMALSLENMLRKGVPRSFLLKKSIRRSVILYGLGLLLINNGYDIGHWRIPGVLQRFGVSYLVVSLILLYVPKKQIDIIPYEAIDDPLTPTDPDASYRKQWYRDILPYIYEWGVASVLLITWFLVTFLLNVPGCGRGYLGPGGLGDYGLFQNCTGGAAGYVDKLIYGDNHMYQWPTCRDTYQTLGYDPEGTLGYLTSAFLCYMGLQAGRIFTVWKSHSSRIKRWLIWGIFWGLLAIILSYGSKNGGPIPLNKNLWSPSFIFAMAGSGNILLIFCYFMIDIKDWWNGAPFIYVGMNPILLYCGHEVLGGYFPFSWQVNYPTHWDLLSMNLVGVSCWLLIAYYMFYHKFFINI